MFRIKRRVSNALFKTGNCIMNRFNKRNLIDIFDTNKRSRLAPCALMNNYFLFDSCNNTTERTV